MDCTDTIINHNKLHKNKWDVTRIKVGKEDCETKKAVVTAELISTKMEWQRDKKINKINSPLFTALLTCVEMLSTMWTLQLF